MYLTINNVTDEKRINLSYSIWNFDSSKEVAVVSMLSNKVQYEMKEPLKLKLIEGEEKQVPKKSYTSRELNAFVERKMIISNLDKDSRIIKMEKLAKVTDMIFYLIELDNSDNLEDGRPSNVLLTYHVTADKYFKDFAHFKPKTTSI